MKVEARAAEQDESESTTRHAPHEIRSRRALIAEGADRIGVGQTLLRPAGDPTIKS
jgi:hypothetical protein